MLILSMIYISSGEFLLARDVFSCSVRVLSCEFVVCCQVPQQPVSTATPRPLDCLSPAAAASATTPTLISKDDLKQLLLSVGPPTTLRDNSLDVLCRLLRRPVLIKGDLGMPDRTYYRV